MANPTSNFGWQMPTPTDLVTDLPADFEVFGQAVDTSLADLKGGTTGQVLSKNSNTDMDFVWVTDAAGDITGVTAGTGISGGGTSGTVTVTNSMATAIDAKGDLIAGTGADAFARVAVGADYTFLQALASQSAGLQYAGAWTAYTPTWTNITVGNGTSTGEYLRIGKMVAVKVSFTFGSTSAISGSFVQVSLPFSADTFYANNGGVIMFDVGSAVYNGFTWNTDANKMNIQAINTNSLYALSADITSTVPFTWTTNDILTAQFIYEAA